MKRKIGNVFVTGGLLLICVALGLFVYNQVQSAQARTASAQVVMQMVEQLETAATTVPTVPAESGVLQVIPPSAKMKEIIIDGRAYIGHLTVPSLTLELPVLSDWDYDKLRIAPCWYYGSVNGNDLVIMAHNYAAHFGSLNKLKPGDAMYFTDANGVTTAYSVFAVDVLDPYAVEDVIAGDFDLTLFTCTYGGQTRICVYCDRMKP